MWKGNMWIFQKTRIHFLITQFDQQPCSVHDTWYMANGCTVNHVPETGTHQSRKDLAYTRWFRSSIGDCPPFFLGFSSVFHSFCPFASWCRERLKEHSLFLDQNHVDTLLCSWADRCVQNAWEWIYSQRVAVHLITDHT